MDSTTRIEVLPNDINREIYNQAYIKDKVLPSRRNWAFTNQFYYKFFRPINLLDIPQVIRLDPVYSSYINKFRTLKGDYFEKVLSYPEHINALEIKYSNILDSSKESLLNKHKIEHLVIDHTNLTVGLFTRFHNWGSSIKSLSLNHVIILPIDNQNRCKTLKYQREKIRKVFNKEELCHKDTLALIFSQLVLNPNLEALDIQKMNLTPRALKYISQIDTLKSLTLDACSFSPVEPLKNLLPLMGNLEKLSIDLEKIDLFSLYELLESLRQSPIRKLTLKNLYFEHLEDLDPDLACILHENFFKASNHLELINVDFDLEYLNEIIAQDFACTRLTLDDTFISEDILEYIITNSLIQTIICRSDSTIEQLQEDHEYLDQPQQCLTPVLRSQVDEVIFNSSLDLESVACLSDINTKRLTIIDSFYTDYLSLFNNLNKLKKTKSLSIEIDDAMLLPSIDIMLSLFIFQSPSSLRFLYIKTKKKELQSYVTKLKLFKTLFPEFFSFSFHGDYISIYKPETPPFSTLSDISWNESEMLNIKLKNHTNASDLLTFLKFMSKIYIPKVTIENFRFKSHSLFTIEEIAPLYTHLFNLSRNIDIDCDFDIFEAVQALKTCKKNLFEPVQALNAFEPLHNDKETYFKCTNLSFKKPQKEPESILELTNIINPNKVSYNLNNNKTNQSNDPYEELNHQSALALLESSVECASISQIEKLPAGLIKPILVNNLHLTKTTELQPEMIRGVFDKDSTIENLDIYFEKEITIDEIKYFMHALNNAFILNQNSFLQGVSLHYIQISFSNYIRLANFMASTTHCQTSIDRTNRFYTLSFKRIPEPKLLPIDINIPYSQQQKLTDLNYRFANLEI